MSQMYIIKLTGENIGRKIRRASFVKSLTTKRFIYGKYRKNSCHQHYGS